MTFPATFTAQVAHIQEIIKDAEQTTLLAELATLQNILSQNIDYIPSYDKKRYALQINEITNEINKLHPPVKPKFGFQMPAKKQDPQAKQVHTKNTEVQEQQSVRLEECEQGKQVKRADLPRDEIILKNLNAASIDLRGEGPEIQTLHLINLHNSIIYTAHVKSSLVIDEMSDCTVYVECQQVSLKADFSYIHDIANAEVIDQNS